MNNNGIYGGDRRETALRDAAAAGAAGGGFSTDPIPTEFVADTQYDAIMRSFGAHGVTVKTAAELAAACRQTFAARKPALINVILDPFAGVESGNVHAFNAPKAKI